jgi:hypothetical protein
LPGAASTSSPACADTDADALRAKNLEPIMLDITNEAEIAALVKRIADDPERRPLRALVNNPSLVTTRASSFS